MIMVPMRDGVGLATDVYLPKEDEGPFPVIFVKTPYNFNKIEGGQLEWAIEAIERGYAFVVQNERGRYYSEGEWEILGRPRTDGYDSLDWIAEQAWSNGNVGTLGCSSTAEWQLALAAEDHPAHKAMVPMAAGAGIGRVGEFYEQGNWYKGGVHQTLFTVWLYSVQQDIRPQFPDDLSREQLQRLRKMYDLAAGMPEVDWKKHLKTLPATDWLESAGANAGPGAVLLARKPNDPGWYDGGRLNVGNASFPLYEQVFGFFDHYLKDEANDFTKDTPGGSYDQRAIEARADVLVYTSEPLRHDTEVTGSVRATLYVSSDVKDTDFTAKLVDVHPDGTAYNVDDTILRARYRDGYDSEAFMRPGEVYELNPTAMSTSYEFRKGHRIRVEIASSKFPQYMRNLNTGGNNYDETESVIAHNSIHHSAEYPTRIVLPVVP
ncbi:MAG: CocE/NonD family hydrolase [Woeseia sp.]